VPDSLVHRLPPSIRAPLRRLVGIVTRPATLGEALAVRRDSRRFAQEHTFLRGPGRADRPRALAASLSAWPYQLKLEGMLLKALELEGLRPSVLTSSAARRVSSRYHETFGFEAVDLERFGGPELARTARRDAADLVGPELWVQELKELRYRGVHVGQQALSTVSRQLFDGSVTPGDPRAQALLRQVLPEAMELVLLSERLLDELEPEIVLFNEARYAGYGPIFETALARELNVVQFVSAFSDDAFVFKRYASSTSRVHPRSLGERSWAAVKAGPWTPGMEAELMLQFEERYAGVDQLSRRLHERTRRRQRSELQDELELDVTKPNAVLFSHVLWDANLFYGDDLFADQEEWLIETIRAAAANPDVNWVVKLHPANVWKRRLEGQTGELPELEAIRSKLGALPRHVRLLLPDTDVSTLSLFELADFALTIRGTVGVEAPVFGVPVVTGGTSHYSGRGFTLDSTTQADYRALLARLHEQPPLTEEQVMLAKKHAHALFVRRPLHFTSFRSVIDHEARGPLSHNLEPAISSRAELEAAEDLRTFARWALDREREDYLEPLSDDVVVDEPPLPVAPDDRAGAVEQPGRAQR
jgi:hypothetical protein